MIKKSFAKVNLAINVIKKLENNYHEVDMIMAKINLYDKLYFSKLAEDNIILTCNNKIIPTDEKNLIYKVIDKVKREFNIREGIRVHLVKSIPVQAGLGGGSSNAATTLNALDEMFSLNLSLEDKINFSKDLGSDIPFFFFDDIVRARGIGEQIEVIHSNLEKISIILVKPKQGISTKLVYENLDFDNLVHPNIDNIQKALEENDYQKLVENMANSLEVSSLQIKPIGQEIIDELYDLGVDKAIVCGSGTSIIAISNRVEVLNAVKNAHVNLSNFVYITTLQNKK